MFHGSSTLTDLCGIGIVVVGGVYKLTLLFPCPCWTSSSLVWIPTSNNYVTSSSMSTVGNSMVIRRSLFVFPVWVAMTTVAT